MVSRRCVAVLFACSLFANALCVPVPVDRLRSRRNFADNEVDSREIENPSIDEIITNVDTTPPHVSTTPDVMSISIPLDDDDDDFEDDFMQSAPTTNGGSSIFSLLNLVTALLPGAGGNNIIFRNFIRDFILRNPTSMFLRRNDIADNEIEIDNDVSKPTFQKLETEEESSSSSGSSGSDEATTSNEDENSAVDENNAAEESIEIGGNRQNSKQISESNGDDGSDGNGSESDSDSDEPPGGGDGQGGGILGLLAGLSGGEDGQSDLGSLLAAVGGIVANLSGDGIDINSLIASGLGLFVGLLSEGEENPGGVLASYLLTSLDTLSGGGAQNNGAFFGTFLSKLIKGTSAIVNDDDSDENGGMKGSDSAGFFASLLMALLGNMSKGSSSSQPW